MCSSDLLDTYGFDAGYSITPEWKLSVGYYYQNGNLNTADGSGVLGRLAYSINEGVSVGTNLSYDSAFKSRFSADIKWRFNTAGIRQSEKQKKAWEKPTIKALTESVKNRDVRVHDKGSSSCKGGPPTGRGKTTGGCFVDPEGW